MPLSLTCLLAEAAPQPNEVASALRGEDRPHVWQLVHRRIELLDTP